MPRRRGVKVVATLYMTNETLATIATGVMREAQRKSSECTGCKKHEQRGRHGLVIVNCAASFAATVQPDLTKYQAEHVIRLLIRLGLWSYDMGAGKFRHFVDLQPVNITRSMVNDHRKR